MEEVHTWTIRTKSTFFYEKSLNKERSDVSTNIAYKHLKLLAGFFILTPKSQPIERDIYPVEKKIA